MSWSTCGNCGCAGNSDCQGANEYCDLSTHTCKTKTICTTGQTQCSGNIIQTCTDNAWINGTDCSTTGQTCSNGQCVGGGCTNGTVRCNGNVIQTCTNNTWINGTDCSITGQTCSNGQCVGGGCTNGAVRCNGIIIQTCMNNAWINGTDCSSSGKTCFNGHCIGCERGDGTFTAKVDYPAGSAPYSVAVGDFNADGILDLAVANGDSNNVSILQGNGSGGRGDGTFAAKVDYPVGSTPFFVAVGDFNADGILDLAVANYGSNSVSILLGNGSGGRGDGTFAAKVDYPAENAPYSVAIGDFNADGILDLAVANEHSANISILLGNGNNGRGDGTFATKMDYTAGSYPTSVAIGDFNADGILDLVVANGNSNSVSILLGIGSGGRGDGTFATNVDYPVGSTPSAVAVGDFNADGILDLAVANESSANVSILLGNGNNGRGNGTFGARVDYLWGNLPTSLAVGDFNADGILDLAVANGDSKKVTVVRGNGSGGRGDGSFTVNGAFPVGIAPFSVVVGDFNADGILDLAVANGDSKDVSILRGNGSGGRGGGTFTMRVDTPAGTAPFFVAVADFNSDGILDLAVANNTSNNVSILRGNGSGGKGDGTFASKVEYLVGGHAHSVSVGDFNADGILDLAVANYSLNCISILLGNGTGGRGDGTFAPKVDYPVGSNPEFVTVGDFDADRILDLAVVTANNVSILLGNGSNGQGNGTFAMNVDYPAGTVPFSAAVGDFNADGIPDLAVANYGSNNVSILLGNGSGGRADGTFAAKVEYPAGSGPSSVVVGDFNADGILDLAVANGTSSNVSILLGNGSNGRGDGTFAAKVDYPARSASYSVSVGDFNADGILDLAVANGTSNNVSILLGNGSNGRGDGTFAAKADYPVGTGPLSVAIGDFNADGILDLAAANNNSNSVSVLLGQGQCL